MSNKQNCRSTLKFAREYPSSVNRQVLVQRGQTRLQQGALPVISARLRSLGDSYRIKIHPNYANEFHDPLLLLDMTSLRGSNVQADCDWKHSIVGNEGED
jgi:hypothetical protein